MLSVKLGTVCDIILNVDTNNITSELYIQIIFFSLYLIVFSIFGTSTNSIVAGIQHFLVTWLVFMETRLGIFLRVGLFVFVSFYDVTVSMATTTYNNLWFFFLLYIHTEDTKQHPSLNPLLKAHSCTNYLALPYSTLIHHRPHKCCSHYAFFFLIFAHPLPPPHNPNPATYWCLL